MESKEKNFFGTDKLSGFLRNFITWYQKDREALLAKERVGRYKFRINPNTTQDELDIMAKKYPEAFKTIVEWPICDIEINDGSWKKLFE